MQAELILVTELLLDIRDFLHTLWEYLPVVVQECMQDNYDRQIIRIDSTIDALLYIAPNEELQLRSYRRNAA